MKIFAFLCKRVMFFARTKSSKGLQREFSWNFFQLSILFFLLHKTKKERKTFLMWSLLIRRHLSNHHLWGSVYYIVFTAVPTATEMKPPKGRKKLLGTTLPPKATESLRDAKRLKTSKITLITYFNPQLLSRCAHRLS